MAPDMKSLRAPKLDFVLPPPTTKPKLHYPLTPLPKQPIFLNTTFPMSSPSKPSVLEARRAEGPFVARRKTHPKMAELMKPSLNDPTMVTVYVKGDIYRPSGLVETDEDDEEEDGDNLETQLQTDGDEEAQLQSEGGEQTQLHGTHEELDGRIYENDGYDTDDLYWDATPFRNGTAPELSKSEVFTQTFELHKSVLCSNSRYFENVLAIDFMEDMPQNQAVSIIANPKIFSILADWLYIQNLDNEGEDVTTIRGWEIVDLWLLGGFLLMPKFQDQVMRLYMQTHDINKNYLWMLRWVWKCTEDDSHQPLRSILVAEYTLSKYSSQILESHLMPADVFRRVHQFRGLLKPKYAKGLSSSEIWRGLEPLDYFLED